MKRRVSMPIYWFLAAILVAVVSPMLAVLVSVKLGERTREDVGIRYCRLIDSQVDVYSEATTPVGRKAYSTWLAEYRQQDCQPIR